MLFMVRKKDGRYVTEKSTKKKCLLLEINLVEQRLSRDKHPNKLFFSYANTVATIDFAKQQRAWMWNYISSRMMKHITKLYFHPF